MKTSSVIGIGSFVIAISFMVTCSVFAAGGGGEVVTADPTKHFDPKGKMPSKPTIEFQNGMRKSLPFDDKRDFKEAKKGFIAAPDYKQIMADAGHVAWDMASYEFLLNDKDFDSVHPSLQRQAVLNMAYGLYEVKKKLFIQRILCP